MVSERFVFFAAMTRALAELSANLNPALPLRPYQTDALQALITRLAAANPPRQLLFEMATGSGKTLVMAGAMLYAYALGYHRVVFFVNSTTILAKTRENFLQTHSPKYLFARQLVHRGTPFALREVSNFQTGGGNDLHLVFTTIQGLHQQLLRPQENALTLHDFEDERVLFISDESHHTNVQTKRGRSAADLPNWESTVEQLLGSHPAHLLLEFTATAGTENSFIREKYIEKTVLRYPLTQFRAEGYSKEIQLLQADDTPFLRTLRALILSQYRKKCFETEGIAAKPVILLKSKNIAESTAFYRTFQEELQRLTAETLEGILAESAVPVFQQCRQFLAQKGLSLPDFAEELKQAFAPSVCMLVNSKTEVANKQRLLNSLEAPENPYRLLFAVDQLNEGWDVLNLFDIVRLYGAAPVKNPQKLTPSSLAEAQLIGRGARYYPFSLSEGQPHRRKFDAQPAHPLRLCETLYYHAAYQPSYLAQLHHSLVVLGWKSAENEQREVAVREKKRAPPPTPELRLARLLQHTYRVAAPATDTVYALDASVPADADAVHTLYVGDFPLAVRWKALDRLPFFQFDRLKSLFPALRSTREWLESPAYLPSLRIELTGIAPHALSPQQQCAVLQQVLQEVVHRLTIS